MTLVVVTDTEVIADSKTVFGASYAETVHKIHDCFGQRHDGRKVAC